MNSTWPLVKINKFQERSASTRSLSGALSVELVPIVTNETRTDWENFSRQNADWLVEGEEYQAKNGLGIVWGTSAPGSTMIPEITGLSMNGTMIVSQGVRAKIDVGSGL